MGKEPRGDRIKPCLECDRLIPFEDAVCPHCRGKQPRVATRNCPHCSVSISSDTHFCPSCGILTTPTAAVPVAAGGGTVHPAGVEKNHEVGLRMIEISAVLCLLWLLVDHVL